MTNLRTLGVILLTAALFSVPLGAYVGYISAERPPGPRAIVSICFDDGLKEAHRNAFYLMRDRGLVGTVFVTWSYIGSKYGMSWDDLWDLKYAGWEIGAHSITHPDLLEATLGQAENEISGSKTLLTHEGFDVHSFAFPYGRWNDTLVQFAESTFDYVRLDYVNAGDIASVFNVVSHKVAEGGWVNLVVHSVNDTGYTDQGYAFVQLVDYLAALQDHGVIRVMTTYEAYLANGGA